MPDSPPIQALGEGLVAILLLLFRLDVIRFLGLCIVWVDGRDVTGPFIPEVHQLRVTFSIDGNAKLRKGLPDVPLRVHPLGLDYKLRLTA